MKTPESGTRRANPQPTTGLGDRPARKALWPAIVASGACSVLATPASALQLGNVDVQSSLGQPLRASIAFALSPNEQLHDYCIFLQPPAAGMPGVRDAVIGVANGRIIIRGTTPLKEPIVSLGIAVSCPYTARLARSYTLMIDPAPVPMQARGTSAVTATPQAAVTPARPQPSVAPATPTRSAPEARSTRSAESIDAGSYRVRPGDTLSDIVARIENRSIGIWSAVGIVFDANPDAFIDGDMNKLKAGSLLTLPSLDGATAARVAAPAEATIPAPQSVEEPPAADSSAEIANLSTAAADVDAPGTAPGAVSVGRETASVPAAASQTTFDETIDLQPGEAVAVTPVAEIDAVNSAGIDVGNDAAAGTTAAEPAEEVGESTPSWLYWTIGAFGLIGFALATFGWRSRRRTPPDAAASEASSIEDETQTVRDEALAFNMDVDGAVAAGDVLDLDLNNGAGLRSVGDVEVAQDFGFSTSHDLGADLDMVLPATEVDDKPSGSSTDIVPVLPSEEHTILEKEILPSDDDDEDGDYDVSMLVDATKQRFSADRDVTTKDLNVIAIDDQNDDDDTGEYTLSNEVDYQILEQDYEDELTATQALNAEILKAAQDLQARIEGDTEDDTATNEVTSLLDQADAAAADDKTPDEEFGTTMEKTVEMAADAGDDTVETRVIDGPDGEELEEFVDDRTAEIPEAVVESRRAEDTQASTQRLSENLPIAGNDDTAEVEVESGHFKTRKSAG